MKSLLHTLEGNESILLMYLVDELPADDRAEVEAMLATDAGLRAELERLTAMHDDVHALIADADTTSLSPRAEAAAQRKVGKAIDQWNVRRLLAVPKPAVVRRSNLRRVLYATAVAAALAVGFSYYRVMSGDPIHTEVAEGPDNAAWRDAQDSIIKDFETHADANEASESVTAEAKFATDSDFLRKSLDASEEMLNDSMKHVDLSAAEREISVVAQLSEPGTIGGGLDFSNDLMQ